MAAPCIEIAESAGVGIDGQHRPTEDRVIPLPHAVIVADGATALRDGQLSGGWYADRLCTALARRLADQPFADLRTVLADAIAAIAAEHGLVPGSAPSSTVAMLRWSTGTVDALVLADSPVVVFTGDGPDVLADDRLAALPRPGGGYRKRLRDGGGYGPDHAAALRASADSFGRLRNVDGGFWVAEADPTAADRARTASWPRAEVTAALLATDGVSCGVDDYGLFDWPDLLARATTDGPAAVLDAVRAAESADPDGVRWPRAKRHDDQTLAVVRF
ncbi:MAG TPA: hypothetical protein VFW65_35095 [Pseudonocardiaceae bacterium]|nr:hypothetical protein [Pseudonocardiaceae bacterium]